MSNKSNTTEEKVLDKVRKLMDLATNAAASEGERENALRMAYALLSKHNLDMADVENRFKEEDRINQETSLLNFPWCRTLILCVGKLFFCKVYIGRRVNSERKMFHFVGKESNVVTASVMSEYLITSILKEARKLYKQDLSPEARSFCVGAMNSIYDRVEKMQEEATNEAVSGSTALVVSSIYKTEMDANAAFLEETGVHLVKSKSRGSSVSDSNAFNKGKEYGNNVSLNTQVSGSKSNKLLK